MIFKAANFGRGGLVTPEEVFSVLVISNLFILVI
jgi:hypothetical protein